jgi:bifunctional pyridoxal-dependent enzyme with beta-cystathionase and maltose regulon repressor activities
MERGSTMHMPDTLDGASAFWSDSYRGHTIAALSHGKGWLAYLDHVLQHNRLFVTAEAAATWLRRQIDAAAVG